MTDHELQKFIGYGNLSVLEAMRKIDENGRRILIIIDSSQYLIGCLTDGDIRRYLLNGGRIHDNVILAVNKNPICAKTIDDASKLIKNKKYIAIPVINSANKVKGIYFSDETIEGPLPSLKIPVVINAGGKGKRLDPYTKILPKPLIPVGELPIIEHIMQRYQKYDCREFHVIVNYKREIMKGYFAENEKKYQITWHDEEKPLGTGGGVNSS